MRTICDQQNLAESDIGGLDKTFQCKPYLDALGLHGQIKLFVNDKEGPLAYVQGGDKNGLCKNNYINLLLDNNVLQALQKQDTNLLDHYYIPITHAVIKHEQTHLSSLRQTVGKLYDNYVGDQHTEELATAMYDLELFLEAFTKILKPRNSYYVQTGDSKDTVSAKNEIRNISKCI